MEEWRVAQIVRQVVREELAPILMGKVIATNDQLTLSARRFSGESALPKIRNLAPYGLASRPKANTEGVVLPIGGDPTHLAMLTQNDMNRPPIANEGEVALYGPNGQLIYLNSSGEIHQGSASATEPVVLGNVMKACIQAICDAFMNPPQLGTTSAGPCALDPSIRSALQNVESTYLNTSSSNILSQKNFVQRS